MMLGGLPFLSFLLLLPHARPVFSLAEANVTRPSLRQLLAAPLIGPRPRIAGCQVTWPSSATTRPGLRRRSGFDVAVSCVLRDDAMKLANKWSNETPRPSRQCVADDREMPTLRIAH